MMVIIWGLLKILGRLNQKRAMMKRPLRQLHSFNQPSKWSSVRDEATAATRVLDNKESELVTDFVSRGCSCDFGPRKTPCSMLFPVEYYQSLRATFAEMSHDDWL